MVELVRQRKLEGIPPRREPGFTFDDSNFAFTPSGAVFCVRPVGKEQHGELLTWPRGEGKGRRVDIPQPKGFKPEYDVETYFKEAAVWANRNGELFLRWQLGGNGDHGLALVGKDGRSFVTARSKLVLANSRALPGPDGKWYFLVWHASLPQGFQLSVYRADERLNLELVGKYKGKGHHADVLGMCFTSRNVLHFIRAEVEARRNHLRILTNDFDLRKRTWSCEQELYRLDKFVSSAQPTVVALKDGSVHYFWEVEDVSTEKQPEWNGLYYQPKDANQPLKLASSHDGFKVVAVGDRLVVCYTEERAPNKVFFRAIRNGKPGPATSPLFFDDRKYNLWGEDMALAAVGDRVWFMNTQLPGVLYEFKLVDVE